MPFQEKQPHDQSSEKLFSKLIEQDLGSYLTNDIREKLALLDIRESTAGKERSHATDIAEIIDITERIRSNASALNIEHPDTNEDWRSLKAAFIFEDIGKATSQEIAALYALNDVPIAATIGANMRTHLGDEFYHAHQESIRNYVLDAKVAISQIHNPKENETALRQEWEQKLNDLENPSAQMRYFWDVHPYYSAQILEKNKEQLLARGNSQKSLENIRKIAGAHHFVEGNSVVPEYELSTLTIWGELLDKIHAGMTRFNNLSVPIEERWHNTWKFIHEQRINRLPTSDIRNRYEQVASALEYDLKDTLLQKFLEIEQGKAL